MKLFVYAYMTFNLGDDLFIRVLSNRYPHTTFFLPAPKNYQKKFRSIQNVKVIPTDTFRFRIINKIASIMGYHRYMERKQAKTCDGVIYIGGSLFMQTANWQRTFKETKAMFMQGKPFFLLGANFGPYQDEPFYRTYAELFQTFTDICFRDEASFELFNHLSQVRKAADVVFQLDGKPAIKQRKTVVISVIKPSIRENLVGFDDMYYTKMKQIIRGMIQQGYSVRLMSFCSVEQDDEAIVAIQRLLTTEELESVEAFFYTGDMDRALHVIRESSYVIATRFHAMILAWIYEKPVLPIVYSDKMTTVMSDLGFDGPYVKIENMEYLRMDTVMQMKQLTGESVNKARASAIKQFEKLDQWIQKSET